VKPMRDQLDLPFGPPRRVRYGQSVAPRPEDEALHRAVLALRRAGQPVYRAGADHKVGDRLVSTPQLLALAEALPRK
jgi:hypothetical protein